VTGTVYQTDQRRDRTLYHYFIRFSRVLEPDEWWQLMAMFTQSMREHDVVIDDFIYSRKEDLAWLNRRGGIDYCEGFVIFAKVDVRTLVKKFFRSQNVSIASIVIE
jgi:hypothetical protein